MKRRSIEKLIANWPLSYRLFGDHRSMYHFAVILYGSDYYVVEYKDCWIFVEDEGDHIGEVHWFCPRGADMDAIRTLLNHMYFHRGFKELHGRAAGIHKRQASMLNRALGAKKRGETYSLTADDFLRYNASKLTRKS